MADPTKPSEELTGWKAIAGHLDVSIRTAQTFEKEHGLPVRRRGGIKAPVYAIPLELDDWKAKQMTLADVEPQHVVSIIEEPHPGHLGRRQWLRYVMAGGAGVLGLSGLSLGTAKLWVEGHQPPTAYRVEGATLIVSGRDNVELWRYTFPTQLFEPVYSGLMASKACSFADLNGDGRAETVFVYCPKEVHPTQALLCFNQGGKRLWKFVPGKEVTDNLGRTFAPPYGPMFGVVPCRTGSARVVVSSLHHWSFPNQIALLDGKTGEVISEYWHRGHLKSLAVADINGDGEPEVLVGGVNDAPDYKQATLLVFDHHSVSGSSTDPKGAPYFQGMNPGTEKWVVFFPKTPISRQEEFNLVIDIRVASGRITVHVAEGISEITAPTMIYEFDFDLRPINAMLSGFLAQRYRELQDSGKLPQEAPEVISKRLMKEIKVIEGRR